MGVAGPIEAALVHGHPRSNICGPVGYTLHYTGPDGLGGAVKQGVIRVSASGKGDDWPDEEMKAIRDFFESRGYVNTSEGSGGTEETEYKWWAVNYERKIDK